METKKLRKIWFICLIMMLALSFIIPNSSFAADTVKIGILEPRTGPLESVGRQAIATIQHAVDEQNKKGGVLGRKIELIVEDSELRPDVAIRKGKKLILKDKVNFIGGGVIDPVAIILNKLATEYKVIHIIYSAQGLDITGREFSRYAFRPTQNLYHVALAQARLLANTGFKRVYIVGFDSLPCRGQISLFKNEVKKIVSDVEFVGEDFHPIGTKDFGPYITKIIAAKPDIIMSGTYGIELGNLIKQSRSLGAKQPFLCHAALDPYLIRDLGDLAIGTYNVNAYSLRVKTPENEGMITKYHETHKNDRDFLTWWPYGQCGQVIMGWRMTFAAVEKAGSLDPEKIIEAFEGFRYKTPVGWWEMRKCDHQVMLPMFGMVMEGGKNPYYNGSINPGVKFPWAGPDIMTFSAEDVFFPATPDYNTRCK